MDPIDQERDETHAERMDRNWNELLQELRVTQTGIQVLAGFLITLPFQQRFSTLGEAQENLYLVVLAAALVSIVLLMTPVIIHRVLFRRGVKQQVVEVSDQLARAGFVTLAITLVLAAALIVWVVTGSTGGWIAGAGWSCRWCCGAASEPPLPARTSLTSGMIGVWW